MLSSTDLTSEKMFIWESLSNIVIVRWNMHSAGIFEVDLLQSTTLMIVNGPVG